MKRFITGIFLLMICTYLFPQKSDRLSHQVLVPAGNIVTHTGLTYQQTIGETAVEVSLPSFTTCHRAFSSRGLSRSRNCLTGGKRG